MSEVPLYSEANAWSLGMNILLEQTLGRENILVWWTSVKSTTQRTSQRFIEQPESA